MQTRTLVGEKDEEVIKTLYTFYFPSPIILKVNTKIFIFFKATSLCRGKIETNRGRRSENFNGK